MKKNIWKLTRVLFLAVILFAFSPLVITQGVESPTLLGLPRTLWLGLLISSGFISLTILGAMSVDSEDEKR